MKNRLLFSLTILSAFIPVGLQAMSGAASAHKYSAAFASAMDEKDNKATGMTLEEIKKFNENQLPNHVDEPKPVDTPADSASAATREAQTQDASTQTPVPAPGANKQRAQEQYDQKNLKPNIDKALAAHALKNCPERLKQAFNALQEGMNFKSYKRFLLIGPSGTGKSTIAQVIADEYNLSLVFHRASFIPNTYQNGGEQNIKAIFEDAFTKQPCVLVLDELNTLFEKHGRAQDSDQGILRALWSMLDESEKHKIIFIGTCNYLKDLPREIATRFPAVIKIDLPNEKTRQEALEFHMNQQKANRIDFNTVDLKKIAQKTNEFSLREIASLIDLASLVAHSNREKGKQTVVNTDDVLKCIPEILERRYNAIDQTTSEWKEYAKTALQYGFQVATFAGQMAFQKWMQDEQFNHANKLHADGKAHQAAMANNQNSAANVAKNSAISAAVGTAAGAAMSYAISRIMSPPTA